ncbi:hypothetical protein EVAR_17675_1 [Eumeta japonica]|uniref:Uncharacterized protein n=1 Tax=Eumeta variegata TaxID=151549 RepID=A0A4C1USY5_EUMVA|nr:hypothetical protein EVAR_17675_1 [Eumeta japonica]
MPIHREKNGQETQVSIHHLQLSRTSFTRIAKQSYGPYTATEYTESQSVVGADWPHVTRRASDRPRAYVTRGGRVGDRP